MKKEGNFRGMGYKLKQTQHALRMHMDDVLRKLGLTTPQYAVLSQLELRPGISNAALARASFITPQTMHGIVSLLEKHHLVKRSQDPNHGRILRAELTEEGYKVLQKAHDLVAQADSDMMRTLSNEEKTHLEQLLLKCLKNLKTIEFSNEK